MLDTKKQFSDVEKKKIANELRNYIATQANGSANKASKLLKNISNGYISKILNEQWEGISSDTWRNLEKQVCNTNEWKIVPTRGYKQLNKIYTDASLYANTLGIIGSAGFGKTQTATHLPNTNFYVVKSNEYFTSRNVLEEILRLMGKSGYGSNVYSMMQVIVNHCLKVDNPVIVIDEADKLHDKVLYFFISLYNELQGKCGLIIQATPYLMTRIMDGVARNKKGYAEIHSRIGGLFLEVKKPNRADVELICKANGVHDSLVITEFYNKSQGDIRKVKLFVHAYLKAA